jgi:hypothetical protein
MNLDEQFLDVIESTQIVDEPSQTVINFGHKLYDYLKTISPDVDRGVGFRCYDLWITVDGVEMFIQVSKSQAQNAKEKNDY